MKRKWFGWTNMYEFSELFYKKHQLENIFSAEEILPYSIGALLYCPSVSEKIADTVLQRKIKEKYSLALCLEDSIHDDAVSLGESQILYFFETIWEAWQKEEVQVKQLPKIFVRVREPKQLITLYQRLHPYDRLLTGFIFPKYSLHCAKEYNKAILSVNAVASKRIYMMPILESPDIVSLSTRYDVLQQLKEEILTVAPYVLNIRVGGNDFCNAFGIRRHWDETIYDTLAISHILSDIITTFSREFVVSAPVWEYFSQEDSKYSQGILQELKKDKQNGFIGKTVIHPSQIPLVNQSLQVMQSDVEDALAILNFEGQVLQVSKSADKKRMNEIKTHAKWAKKTLLLAGIYGVKE